MSRWFSRPFTQLASAAAMLGRGRFDLDLPTTRIPEVQAVSAALGASASALRDRLAREQQFSVHASHVLRTPLTSLRLNLDELDAADLDPHARRAAQRCLVSVEQLDQVASDLVDITRRGALMAGAEIPLRELAAAVAQQWADGTDRAGPGLLRRGRGRPRPPADPGSDRVRPGRAPRAGPGPEGPGGPARAGRRTAGAAPRGHRRRHHRVVPRPVAGAPTPTLTRVDQARSLVESLGGRWQDLPRRRRHPRPDAPPLTAEVPRPASRERNVCASRAHCLRRQSAISAGRSLAPWRTTGTGSSRPTSRGLDGVRPDLPMAWAELERRAHETMPERIWSYVAGGAGDEQTQRANAEAFARWGAGAADAGRRRGA